MKYDTVIGLEVHIQMNTASKAFCADENLFGDAANEHVSAISVAHPGTLPVANTKHIEKAIKLGAALGCRINEYNFFDRKHYFYPDLPKGYQITQDNEPICIGGEVTINVNGVEKTIRIHHIHMEEDAGKTIHDVHDSYSLIDLNRAGTPLLELVTEPDLSSGDEVYAFIAELQKLLRFLKVSNADMEKGSMRCDCNVSIKPAGAIELGERCEIKNLNSKRFAKDAVQYETKRQIQMVENGISFGKQTLHYDPETKVTSVLREKEGVADYRYFPDPDMPPIQLEKSFIASIKASLPKLPATIKKELVSQDGLTLDYAEQLSQHPEIYNFYQEACAETKENKGIANLLVNQILPSLDNIDLISNFPISPKIAANYISFLNSGKVNKSIANKELWPALINNPAILIEELASKLNLLISTDNDAVDELVSKIVADHPDQVQQFKKGKKALIGFFIGAAMKQAKGAVDANQIKSALMKALNQ